MLINSFRERTLGWIFVWLARRKLYAILNLITKTREDDATKNLFKCVVHSHTLFHLGAFIDCHQMCIHINNAVIEMVRANGIFYGEDLKYLRICTVILGACAEDRVLSKDQRVFDKRLEDETWDAFCDRLISKIDFDSVDKLIRYALPLRRLPAN